MDQGASRAFPCKYTCILTHRPEEPIRAAGPRRGGPPPRRRLRPVGGAVGRVVERVRSQRPRGLLPVSFPLVEDVHTVRVGC